MASPITAKTHPDSLNPVYKKLTYEGFNRTPDLVSLLFGTETSDRNQELFATITGMGDFTEHQGTIDYDGPDQGYTVTATHKEFSKGLMIGRTILDDDQHGQIVKMFKLFGDSAFQTRQKDAAQPFNSAFTVDSEFFSHEEGVPLVSNSHTTPRAGVSTTNGFDNLYTAALSGTAVSAARYNMRLFKQFNGEPIDEIPGTLIVPAELEDKAFEIVKTRTGLDTADGNYNPQQSRYDVISSVRLTDSNNWFAVNKSMMKENLIWMDRIPFETDRMEHFDSFSFKARGYMRYSYYWLLWQWIVGHQVS